MNILQFSKPILIYTLSFLAKEDLENCLLTCKRFRECTYQNLGKYLFRDLGKREIKKVLEGPYGGLAGDYPIPIGLKAETHYSLRTLLKLFDHKNGEKVQISKIKLGKQSLLQERLKSITNVFSLEQIVNGPFDKIFIPQFFYIRPFKEFLETAKKNLKMITLPIWSFEELDHLLELEKITSIPARIFVDISDISGNTLDLWKDKLQNLPSGINVCGLSFYRDWFQPINNDQLNIIEEMCKSFQIKSLSLTNCLKLDLSNCNSLLKLKVDGADCSHVNLILPKQLKTLKINVYNWKGPGINGSRCFNLSQCVIYKPQKAGKIILPKSLVVYHGDFINREKYQNKGKGWQITWI